MYYLCIDLPRVVSYNETKENTMSYYVIEIHESPVGEHQRGDIIPMDTLEQMNETANDLEDHGIILSVEILIE